MHFFNSPTHFSFNPDFEIDARTKTQKLEPNRLEENVDVHVSVRRGFLKGEAAKILRRIPRPIANSGFKSSSWTLLKIYIAQLLNLFKTRKKISIRGGIVVLFLLGYLAGGYEFFLWSFRFIISFPFVGPLLLEHLFYFFFFILWFMLIFSNAIIAFMTQYKSPEVAFLMSLPINPRIIFYKQLLEGMFWSSWGFLFLASPLVIAYGVSMRASYFYYPAAVIFLLPYVFLAAMFGSIITFLVLNTAQNKKNLTVFVGLCISIVLLSLLKFPSNLEGPADEEILSFFRNFLEKKGGSRSPFLPPSWLSGGLIQISSGNFKTGFFFLCLILGVALTFGSFIYFFGDRLYLRAWEKGQEGGVVSRQTLLSKIILRLRLQPLAKKDLLYFFRDPAQWVQSVVLTVMMIFYISNLKQVHHYVDHPYWENLIYFFNLTTLGLLIATFSLRFVYPQFSLEWRRSWIIGLIPISKAHFFKTKFYFYGAILFVISQTLNLLSNHMIESSLFKIIMSSYVITFLCMGLVGLSLGLGRIYPNVKTDDPSKIMSSLGGVLTLVLSMAYLAMTLIPLSIPFHLVAMNRLNISTTFFIWVGGANVFIAILSILLIVFLLRGVLKRPCPE